MEKILLADDDQEVQEIVKTILEKEGYAVTVAKDGNETIEAVKKDKPDMIILDYLMPGLSGVEVLKILQGSDESKNIPVLMVTAHPTEKQRALDAGAVDFITKPVEKPDLLLRIKSVLKVRHISNELQKIIAYISELEK
jgi:two-component system, OmpR family, alkaline phosphatase synthesis response regulator PhoP